jgi:predicted RecB family nuclease
VPIRFVPFEKISKHYKLMLAFDALVLWKASGQMPTQGMIIHGLKHTILSLGLDTLIHEVQLLVGKLRALLSESGPPDPVLIKHCPECEFETYCRKRVTEKDLIASWITVSIKDHARH